MTICTVGMQKVANLIGVATNASGSTFGYVAIGTSATAVDPAQTILVAEVKRFTYTNQSVTSQTLTTTYDSFNFTAGALSINECGMFGIVTANTGPILCRALTGNIACGTTDTLKVTITVEVKQGA
jgi:hypothetical protein